MLRSIFFWPVTFVLSKVVLLLVIFFMPLRAIMWAWQMQCMSYVVTPMLWQTVSAEENFCFLFVCFFLNIAFKLYYKLKKRFVLEVFYHRFSVDESKLHTCWITAKVFICFLLGLWLGFLFDIPVEQIVFITVFQSSKTYQQHTFAGFPCWCKHYLVLWGVGVGIGYDSCGAFKTSNSKFSR